MTIFLEAKSDFKLLLMVEASVEFAVRLLVDIILFTVTEPIVLLVMLKMMMFWILVLAALASWFR